MNFKSLHDKFSKFKFTCDITNLFKIKRILFGSGGSSNIIIDVSDKARNQLIIKIIPEIIYTNVKIKPDYNQLEIKFYQFFTKKYILNDRTPHIVGIYNHQNCSRIDKILKNINPSKNVCPSYEDQLTKRLKISHVESKLCDLILRHEMKLIDPVFDVVFVEHCPGDLSGFIRWYMNEINFSKKSKIEMQVDNFIHDLNRILFQIIFTLAIIKEDYPGFLHGDFFARNILLAFESDHYENDFVAYYYKQRIFYLPANGQYAKINDFGLSVIVDELEPNIYKLEENVNKFYHIDPFDQKSDIFNLFHDIYDGENLGTVSINAIAKELYIPSIKLKKIKQFLGKFIKLDVIDKINVINPGLLDETWNINKITILEKTVLTPDQYLTKNFFEMFQKLPPNARIVRHFNKPK